MSESRTSARDVPFRLNDRAEYTRRDREVRQRAATGARGGRGESRRVEQTWWRGPATAPLVEADITLCRRTAGSDRAPTRICRAFRRSLPAPRWRHRGACRGAARARRPSRCGAFPDRLRQSCCNAAGQAPLPPNRQTAAAVAQYRVGVVLRRVEPLRGARVILPSRVRRLIVLWAYACCWRRFASG